MNLDSSKRIARSAIPRVQYSRRDFYGQLARHKKKSILVFLLVMSGAILLSVYSPKVYQSQSLLYVRLGRENVRLDPTTTLGQASVITIPNSRETEINSVVEILKSRAIAEHVVEALGPDLILNDSLNDDSLNDDTVGDIPAQPATVDEHAESPATRFDFSQVKATLQRLDLLVPISRREQAIRKLGKGLTARAVSKTDLLSIAYQAHSPALAQQVVAKFTEVYLNEHAGLNRPANADHFLEQQTQRLSQELRQTEQALIDLKQTTNMASPESQMQLSVTRLYRLQDDLLNTEALAAGIQSEIEALGQKLQQLSESRIEAVTTGQSNPAADGMRQLLYSLQLQEQKIAGMYTDDHPLMAGIKEQIAQSQAILSQEQDSRQTVTEGPNRAFEELNIARLKQETLLKSAQAKATALQEQVSNAQQQLETQIQSELQVARLQRDVELQDASYRTYFENLEQAKIDQSLENERISNINVIQPASLVEKPLGPNILLNLIAGLFGGFIAAIGTAILCDVFDHSLKSPEEIEQKLNVPLLVSIPRLDRRMLQISGNVRK